MDVRVAAEIWQRCWGSNMQCGECPLSTVTAPPEEEPYPAMAEDICDLLIRIDSTEVLGQP